MRPLKRQKAEMTTREVAIVLDVTPDDVATLARKGILRGYKIGKQWRFAKRDVKSLAKQLKKV
jgi:excisionase family DNA binding protein